MRRSWIVGLLALWACGGDPDEVDVRVYVPNSGDILERVEVSVIRACGTIEELGDAPVDPIRVVEPLDAAQAIGRLDEGSYALYGRAWMADCVLFAAGCDSFRIPDEDGVVDVALATLSTRACDEGQVCDGERCVPE